MPVPVLVGQRAQAPMSLAQMIDICASYVRSDGPEVRGICANGINMAIRDLNKRHWYWSLTFQDIVTAQRADFDLASDYDGFRSAQLYDTNNNPAGRLNWLDPQTFWDTYNVSTTPGDPCHCTVDSPESTLMLTLNCIPTAAWVAKYPKIRLRYYRLVPTLENESEAIAYVPPSVQNYVLWYGMYFACLNFDPEGNRLTAAMGEKERLWTALGAKNTSYNFSD